MKLSKIISTAIEKSKLIIKILGYGSADVQTVYTIQPFGIDGNPVPGYRGIFADTSSKEDKILIGVLFENAMADIGELRLHSEDANGNEMASLHFKNTGEVELIANGSATLIAKDDGTIEINGNADNMVRYSELKTGFDQLKQDFNNFITIYNAHVHPGVTSGSASTSPPPVSGSSSGASINASKIDNVKTN